MLATRLAKQLSTRLLPHCTRTRQRCTLGAWIAPKLATSVHRLSAGRSHCRRWWANTRFLHSTVAAEESNLLRAIRSGGAQGGVVELEDVLKVIDAHYDYTPVAFANGALENAPGENVGSCKLLFWAQMHGLSSDEVLFAFGRHYRDLEPSGTSHQNIRSIIANGMGYVRFASPPLSPKYCGEWDPFAHRPHGQGKMVWDNGVTYDGSWKDGLHHGQGSKWYPDGNGYIGQWRDGWRHGKGVLYFGSGAPDTSSDGGRRRGGRRWEGNFEQDKAHGMGIMYNGMSANLSTDCTDAGVAAEYTHGKLLE